MQHLNRVLKTASSPVTSDPETLGGTLVFRGTRVPAQSLIDYLNDGFTMVQFLDYFPSVQREDAVEFLRLIERQTS